MSKRASDIRYQPYGDRRDRPIGVFATGEEGRSRFMDAVARVMRGLQRPRSRLDAVAFGRGDAVLYALAVMLEEARTRYGYSAESVDELLARVRKA